MNKLLSLLSILIFFACTTHKEPKIPCYVWTGGP